MALKRSLEYTASDTDGYLSVSGDSDAYQARVYLFHKGTAVEYHLEVSEARDLRNALTAWLEWLDES